MMNCNSNSIKASDMGETGCSNDELEENALVSRPGAVLKNGAAGVSSLH
jgi:hypothetical protein